MAPITQKSNFILYTVAFLLLAESCRTESINCGEECADYSGIIIKSGFEKTLLEVEKNAQSFLTGIGDDQTWEDLQNHPNIGNVYLYFETGDSLARNAKLVSDPLCTENTVLAFQINQPHINEGLNKKGRVQLDVNDNQCITSIHQKVRLYLHPEMDYLTQMNDQISWLSLFEFWNNADWTNERYPFRVTVNVFKQKGANNSLYFHVKGDYKKNCTYCKWNVLWEEQCSSFPIPTGEWMDIEIFILEGNANTGHFYMAVTPSSGQKITLFDRIIATQHPDEDCPDGFSHIHPLKFYTSDEIIRHMSEAHKTLAIYWDDWEFSINQEL